MRASATVGEALDRTVRFYPLLKQDGAASLTVDTDRALLTLTPPGQPWPRHLAEAVMANIVVVGRQLAGADFRPRLLRLQHARPRRMDEHQRLFDCPVLFEQPATELLLDRALLSLKLPSAEAALCEYLEELASSMVATLPLRSMFARELRGAIATTLEGGQANLEGLARQLGLSSRTLQRRMRTEGLNYQRLIDAERFERALELLRHRELLLAEVGERLGFSEPSAFRRAFQRWTGSSPRAYRQALLAGNARKLA